MGMPVSLTMSQTGVRLFLLLSILTISKVFGGCFDFTCRHQFPDGVSRTWIPVDVGVSRTWIPVDVGDKHCEYNTHPAENKFYPPPQGVRCHTNYNSGDEVGDCPRIRFDCKALHLRNRDPVLWRCNRGDKLIIYSHWDGDVHHKTRKYCRNRAPRRVVSTTGLRLQLIIQRGTRGGQGGIGCRAKCIEY